MRKAQVFINALKIFVLLLIPLLVSTCQIFDSQPVKPLVQQAVTAQTMSKYGYVEDYCRRDKDIEQNLGAPQAYTKQGLTLISKGQIFEPLPLFCKAIQLDSNNALAYKGLGYALGMISWQAGVPQPAERARAAYRKAIEIDPSDIWAYKGLASVLDPEENASEAFYVYRRITELNPNDASAYRGLGDVPSGPLLEQSDPKAKAAYLKAIGLDSKNVEAYIGLGNLLISSFWNNNNGKQIQSVDLGKKILVETRQERLDEAETVFRNAIKLDPNNAFAYIGLGGTLNDFFSNKRTSQDKLNRAADAYRKAIKLDPTNAFGYLGLSRVLPFERQEAILRTAIELDAFPLSEVYESLIILLRMQNRFSEASDVSFNAKDKFNYITETKILRRQNKLKEMRIVGGHLGL